jgi:uncharacterized membrane protein YhaH (DUF805 family)
MLAAIFSFRGRLNRIQYFLGSWGLGFALIVLAVILFVGALGGRSPEQPQNMASLGLTVLFCIAVLGPIYLWVSFSLQARRFRDIGWEPTYVIPAWIGLDLLDRLAVWAVPPIAVTPDSGVSWLGLLLNLALGGCLLFWPGRPPFDVAAVFNDVPPPSQPAGPPRGQPAMARPGFAPAARTASPAAASFGRRGL